MKRIYKDVELDYSDVYREEHEPVIVIADVITEIVDGEEIVSYCIAKEANEVFGVKAGEWFDPCDSIEVESLTDWEYEEIKD